MARARAKGREGKKGEGEAESDDQLFNQKHVDISTGHLFMF